ncbi:hypothetical protein PoB_004988600 [Plakobranchus ocellatus]|uniref:Uncharacterized protein n=1 Tax=Plakobranchus ocellatus TaxID=259542 RepID=A0AAV4BJ49_9GAST|nr:hypothetical protein PoB_004988600 [Plakobranchus ocellatus]
MDRANLAGSGSTAVVKLGVLQLSYCVLVSKEVAMYPDHLLNPLDFRISPRPACVPGLVVDMRSRASDSRGQQTPARVAGPGAPTR